MFLFIYSFILNFWVGQGLQFTLCNLVDGFVVFIEDGNV